MPCSTTIPVPKIEDDCYDWYERHDKILGMVSARKYELVFIGDSITHFWEGAGPGIAQNGTPVWQERIAKYKAINLGYGFDRTQNVLWRLDHGELAGQSPKLIVLNIGTNQYSVTPKHPCDSPEDAFEGVKAILLKLRQMCPSAKIVVMAVFPRIPQEFFNPLIDSLNQKVKAFTETQEDMPFLDISSSFRNPDGSVNRDMYVDEGCHPNVNGYNAWADALEPYFAEAGLSC